MILGREQNVYLKELSQTKSFCVLLQSEMSIHSNYILYTSKTRWIFQRKGKIKKR